MNPEQMYEYYDETGRKIIAPLHDLRTGQPLVGEHGPVLLNNGAPASYPNPTSTNAPQDEALWRKVEAAKIELQKNAEKNRQEIEKKAALEQVKTAGEQKRAEIRADVAAKAALHSEEVVLLRDGRVAVRKEAFNGFIDKLAPFRVDGDPLIYCCSKAEGKVLFATITLGSGSKADFYISLASLTANRINEAFDKIGMSFEAGRKKEREFREKFINTLVAYAKLEELPYCDDWYRTDSGWQYIFPSEKTWLEVLRNVK